MQSVLLQDIDIQLYTKSVIHDLAFKKYWLSRNLNCCETVNLARGTLLFPERLWDPFTIETSPPRGEVA